MRITLEEFQDNFKYEILKPTDCVKTFHCGDEDLDNFIIKESADYTKSLLSVTYIVTDKSKNKVVAYFSLAADKLSVNDFASNSEFNRFMKRMAFNRLHMEHQMALPSLCLWICIQPCDF